MTNQITIPARIRTTSRTIKTVPKRKPDNALWDDESSSGGGIGVTWAMGVGVAGGAIVG